MINASMRMVGVDGPVAVMSWGPQNSTKALVRSLPPAVLDRVARQPGDWRVNAADVMEAATTLMRQSGAVYVGEGCAAMPADEARQIRPALRATMRAIDASFGVLYFHPVPGPGTMRDIAIMVSAGAMTRDAAAQQVRKQVRIWDAVAEAVAPRMVLRSLAQAAPTTMGWATTHNKRMPVKIGPQVVFRVPGPREKADANKDAKFQMSSDCVQMLARSHLEASWAQLPSCLVVEAKRLDSMYWVPSDEMDPEVARRFGDYLARLAEAVSRDFVHLAIVPVGFADVAAALRYVRALERSGNALDYVRTQAEVWRDAARRLGAGVEEQFRTG